MTLFSRLLTLLVIFFNDTATTEIYTLSLHDALPISPRDRVLMEVAVDRRVGGLDQLGRRREVRHALREVDAPDLGHDARHLADDGLVESLDPLRDPGRAHAPDAAFVKRWAAARRRRRPASLPETRVSTRRVGGTLKTSERACADSVVDGRRAGLRLRATLALGTHGTMTSRSMGSTCTPLPLSHATARSSAPSSPSSSSAIHP